MTESSHPRAKDIAAYVDNRISEDERAVLEAHFADCNTCCEEIVAVRRLQATSGSRRPIVWAVGGSAAVAAAVLLLIGQPWKEPASSTDQPSSFQRAASATSTVTVVSPHDGSTLPREDLVFSWRKPEGEDALYQFVITTESADSVWATTTQDTLIVPPADMLLEQSTTYLWYVDALLPDGRPASTGIHSFRVQ